MGLSAASSMGCLLAAVDPNAVPVLWVLGTDVPNGLGFPKVAKPVTGCDGGDLFGVGSVIDSELPKTNFPGGEALGGLRSRNVPVFPPPTTAGVAPVVGAFDPKADATPAVAVLALPKTGAAREADALKPDMPTDPNAGAFVAPARKLAPPDEEPKGAAAVLSGFDFKTVVLPSSIISV